MATVSQIICTTTAIAAFCVAITGKPLAVDKIPFFYFFGLFGSGPANTAILDIRNYCILS